MAAEWEGKIIHQIAFDRTENFSDIDLFRLIGMGPGERYRTDQIRRGIEALYRTGNFKDIWVEALPFDERKVILRFVMVEKRLVSSIDLSGNHFLSEKEIRRAMGMAAGDEFTEAGWEKALAAVASLYRNEGFFQAKFSTRLKPSAENRREQEISLKISEGNRARIRNLSFKGERGLSDLTSIFVIGIRSQKKEYYQLELLEEDLRRLRRFYEKEGYLKAVIGPPVVTFVEEGNEVDITIPIASFNKIEIFFEGDLPFKRKALESRLLIKEERSDEEDILEESARRIEAFYRSEGYPFAKVTSLPRRFPEQNRMEARFKIESGFRAEIRDIVLTGHPTFSDKRLKKLLHLEEEKFFTKSRYTERAVEEDVATLVSFYKKEGFRNVRVSSKTEWDPSNRFATLSFNIDEGVRTRVEAVELKGNLALSDEALKKDLAIQPSLPYNDPLVKEGARQILSSYTREGYLRAEVEPSTRFSDDRTGAAVHYEIAEGEQIRLGKVLLRGNLRTRDNVLLREITLKGGDPYNPEKILSSQKQLYRTGNFSVVQFEPVPSESDPAVQDLQLTVVERPNIALEFGFGYADLERLSGFFEVAHRNLFGTGRKISARAQASSIEKRYTLNYKEPWIFSRHIDARLVAAYLDLDDIAFDRETISVTTGVDKSFSDRVKGSLLYQFEVNDITDVAPGVVLTSEDIGRVQIASINPSIVRDSRDDPFNPREGSVNSITFRDAARILRSDAQFVKVNLQSSWYQALSSKWVLAVSARAGIAERFGRTELIPLIERFFLGGRSTVRGYAQNRLGIRGATLTEDGEPTGGNTMLVFNEELRIALPRSLGLVLFFDHGNVWPRYRDVSFSDIKSTTGIGFRYNTPVGPFRIDWGYKLNREEGESPSAVHFTLGHAF